MARRIGSNPGRAVRAARVATIGAALTALFAVVSTGGAAEASVQNYSAAVNSTGLDIALGGVVLTGGFANACTISGISTGVASTPCASKAAPEANANSEGILLTSSGLDGKASAEASANGVAKQDPANSTPPTSDTPGTGFNCSPLSTGGPQGGGGVTLDLGVACANAQAAVDAGGVPSANSEGHVAHLNVDLAGILGPILTASSSTSGNNCDQNTSAPSPIGALLNGVCQIVNGVAGPAGNSSLDTLSKGVDQALQNLTDVVSKNLNQTIAVTVGDAVAQINQGSDGTVTAYGKGSTVDINLLEGVGCTAGTALLTCATNEAAGLASGQPSATGAPLVEVTVAPATCTLTHDPSNGTWASKAGSALIDIEVNLPGDNLSIPILANQGISQTILGGTPLQSTIQVATTASSPLGLGTASCAGDSVTLSLLTGLTGGAPGLPSIPGLPSGGGGGGASGGTTCSATGVVGTCLGTTTASAASGTATPPTAPGGCGSSCPNTPPAVVPTASVTSPTAVHTGEFWAGSLPLLAVLASIGAALIGWPRLRRFTPVARVIHRGGR